MPLLRADGALRGPQKRVGALEPKGGLPRPLGRSVDLYRESCFSFREGGGCRGDEGHRKRPHLRTWKLR